GLGDTLGIEELLCRRLGCTRAGGELDDGVLIGALRQHRLLGVLPRPPLRKLDLEPQVGMEEQVLPEEALARVVAEDEVLGLAQELVAVHLERTEVPAE